MLNQVVIMGRMVRDPEIKSVGDSGILVSSFILAVDRDFTDKESGERGVDFIDCVAWRGTAEFVTRYFTKGRSAVVQGRLQIRNYTDKQGNKRRAAEVVAEHVYFADSKKAESGGGYINAGDLPIQAADEPAVPF